MAVRADLRAAQVGEKERGGKAEIVKLLQRAGAG